MDNQLSPTFPKPKDRQPKTMFFYEALKNVAKGAKITRLEWGEGYWGVLKENDGILILQLRKPSGMFHQWIIQEGDMTAKDWTVVK